MPIHTTQALATLRTARAETSDAGRRAIASYETTMTRAVEAASHDADIHDEVEAVVTRHAPSFIEEYVRARRRATAVHATTLDDSLIKTLDTLSARLGDLMDQQSVRGVEDVADKERFIAQRHGKVSDALT